MWHVAQYLTLPKGAGLICKAKKIAITEETKNFLMWHVAQSLSLTKGAGLICKVNRIAITEKMNVARGTVSLCLRMQVSSARLTKSL